MAVLLAACPTAAWGAEPGQNSTAPATPSSTGTTAATTHSAADPVDVKATVTPSVAQVAPGRQFFVDTRADRVTGVSPKLDLTLHFPAGVTYVPPSPGNTENTSCALAAGGHALTCHGNAEDPATEWQPSFKVAAGVPSGTKLVFTETVDIGSAVDANPQDNTASGSVLVKAGSDWSVRWTAPAGPVQPGVTVHASVVLTNHGPYTETNKVRLRYGKDSEPTGTLHHEKVPAGCDASSAQVDCEVTTALAPGKSATFTFSWEFSQSSRGGTLRLPAALYPQQLDPNPANDTATLVIKVAKAPATTSTPTTTASSNAGPQSGVGGTELADTGAAGTRSLLAAALALLLLGGALVLRTATRSGAGRRHH